MAATGATFAQSTVTLSGVFDYGLQKTASGQQLQAISSRNSTSNFTIAGTEDLGGGLKAVFKASSSFTVDSASALTFGNNDMYLGLEGGFGSLRMGRSLNPLFSANKTANGTKGVTGYHTVGTVGKQTLDNAGVYVANQVLYTTPSFSGITASVSFAPKETAGQKDHAALGVNYDNGPLALSFAYGNQTDGNGLVTNAKNLTVLGAAYDMGVAKVSFTYQDDAQFSADSDNAYAFGVTVPMGSGSLWASYGITEFPGTDGKTFQLGYKYNLSKRTTAYVQMGNMNKTLAIENAYSTTKGATGFGLGLAHSF